VKAVVESVRVTFVDPAPFKATYVWVRDIVGPEGETRAESVTGSGKSWRLVSVIVELADEPTATLVYVGLVETLNPKLIAFMLLMYVDQHSPQDSVRL